MRVTIIPDDGFVSVDGEGFLDIDLSSMPANIHAVQWYHTEGEVEYRDDRGRATHNEAITDLTPYQPVLSCGNEPKTPHLRPQRSPKRVVKTPPIPDNKPTKE